MKKKLLMSVAVLLGLFTLGELGSRLIWSVSDLSLSGDTHLIGHRPDSGFRLQMPAWPLSTGCSSPTSGAA